MTSWSPLSPSRLQVLSFGTACGMTDTGRVRLNNEDNFLIDERLGLLMVADGMGGHLGGSTASAEALEALQRYLSTAPIAPVAAVEELAVSPALAAALPLSSNEQDVAACVRIADAIDFANHRVFDMNAAMGHTDGDGMGTTLTGIWQHRPGRLVVFHVGDSRLYRYRAGALQLLTHDQTLYQHAIDAGLTDNLPNRNLLLQAVGPTSTVSPLIQVLEVQNDDLYLLCSDGLHGELANLEIARILQTAHADGLTRSCANLIALANDAGGTDNVTVVLTHCH